MSNMKLNIIATHDKPGHTKHFFRAILHNLYNSLINFPTESYNDGSSF